MRRNPFHNFQVPFQEKFDGDIKRGIAKSSSIDDINITKNPFTRHCLIDNSRSHQYPKNYQSVSKDIRYSKNIKSLSVSRSTTKRDDHSIYEQNYKPYKAVYTERNSLQKIVDHISRFSQKSLKQKQFQIQRQRINLFGPQIIRYKIEKQSISKEYYNDEQRKINNTSKPKKNKRKNRQDYNQNTQYFFVEKNRKDSEQKMLPYFSRSNSNNSQLSTFQLMQEKQQSDISKIHRKQRNQLNGLKKSLSWNLTIDEKLEQKPFEQKKIQAKYQINQKNRVSKSKFQKFKKVGSLDIENTNDPVQLLQNQPHSPTFKQKSDHILEMSQSSNSQNFSNSSGSLINLSNKENMMKYESNMFASDYQSFWLSDKEKKMSYTSINSCQKQNLIKRNSSNSQTSTHSNENKTINKFDKNKPSHFKNMKVLYASQDRESQSPGDIYFAGKKYQQLRL